MFFEGLDTKDFERLLLQLQLKLVFSGRWLQRESKVLERAILIFLRMQLHRVHRRIVLTGPKIYDAFAFDCFPVFHSRKTCIKIEDRCSRLGLLQPQHLIHYIDGALR